MKMSVFCLVILSSILLSCNREPDVAPGIKLEVIVTAPSISTCGIAFVTSDTFGSFKGSLLVAGLVSNNLHRCVISGNKITEEEPLLSNAGRVRDVAEAPDGSIYVSAENPGRIIKITPE